MKGNARNNLPESEHLSNEKAEVAVLKCVLDKSFCEAGRRMKQARVRIQLQTLFLALLAQR